MRLGSWSSSLLAALLALACAFAPAGARETGALPTIDAHELPPEAQATLARIKRGGPFPYRKDGSAFRNRERLLPLKPPGYYTEYTVPTTGRRDRGARRIVAGGDPATSGEYYYTDDHYQTFRRIKE